MKMDEVALLPFEDRHLNETTVWMKDPEVLKGILKNKMESRSLSTWVANFYNQPNCDHFAIYNGKVHIGNTSLINLDRNTNCAEMFIYLGKDRSLGYGKKALRMLLSYCFDVKLLKKLYVTVGENNIIAKHLYKKCGFALERVFENVFFQNGKNINVIKMVRTNED